ncbi:hypothetical protein C7271_20770 [filamentous cyanobacterium CCP5]|nr:hypothetical protein C7271_20770 [filamentous cyanobacterium CCP5]
MRTLLQPLVQRIRTLAVVLLGFCLITTGFVAPAAAAETYVTPDGEDITAVVDCLPEELSEGDLQRAIAESGKDYLERVFNLKDDYSDYDIAAAEEEFQACLESKGITPAAQQS